MIEEEMLKAWIFTSTRIKEDRFIVSFNFNEMITLDYIYEAKNISFNELCNKTGFHKSQMNRTINSLLNKGVVTYVSSDKDKRKKFISITESSLKTYEDEHLRLVNFMKYIKDELGEEETKKLIELLYKLGTVIEKGTK